MFDLRRSLIVISFVAAAFLLGSSALRGEGPLKAKAPERIAKILAWLPENSETLIVAEGPFEFPAERGSDRSLLGMARTLSYGLPNVIRSAPLAEGLKGQKVSLAVEASRRFTSPADLGMMPYEGCQILIFDESCHDAVQAAVDACLDAAPESIELGSVKAAVFTERQESDDWTYFVASPERGVLLCATNRSFLEETLSRMKEAKPDRAFPDSLPEWRHIDFESSVWGLRHFCREFAADDPSSPFRGPAPSNIPDAQAIGCTFWIGGENDRVANFRYLSDSVDVRSPLKLRWHHRNEQLTPTFEEVATGVFEITATIDPATHSGPMLVFVLMGHLGHGLYL